MQREFKGELKRKGWWRDFKQMDYQRFDELLLRIELEQEGFDV